MKIKRRKSRNFKNLLRVWKELLKVAKEITENNPEFINLLKTKQNESIQILFQLGKQSIANKANNWIKQGIQRGN